MHLLVIMLCNRNNGTDAARSERDDFVLSDGLRSTEQELRFEECRPSDTLYPGAAGHELGLRHRLWQLLGRSSLLARRSRSRLFHELAELRHQLEELLQGTIVRQAAVAACRGSGTVAAIVNGADEVGGNTMGDGGLVCVASHGGGEQAVIFREIRATAEVHHGRSEVAVLGVADPRRLTRGLHEGLGAQDDLGTGGEHGEKPLRTSREDNHTHELPSLVFAAAALEGPGAALMGKFVCLGGHHALLVLPGRCFATGDRLETATMCCHVLHLMHQARRDGRIQLLGRRDDPEVLREGRRHLPGAWPPLPARLLGHVRLLLVRPGQVKPAQTHREL
mmetsp:Transcript_25678/g.65232  ORF Transcript_25678/g.65232 Transcript_25678/m.65232 type:complete len:335 (+) Transcript_25678:730-1734(+)